jgi:hypothetical protein
MPLNVQRIHELGDQIENVDTGMAFEHGHRNKVQVDQLATIADTYAQVENDWPRCALLSPASNMAQTDSSLRMSMFCCNATTTKTCVY